MKKLISIITIFCLMIPALSAFAAAETIIIDGTPASIPPEMGKIVEQDSRTMVPIRFITEYLGCTVSYDMDTKTAIITDTTKTYIVQVGNNKLFITPYTTGTPTVIEMDTTAVLNTEENRTYIPIRFLSEAIGYTVGWDEATQTVTLNKTI